MMHIRLLPLMIFFAFALLIVKLVDVVRGTQYLTEWMIRPLWAETPHSESSSSAPPDSTTAAPAKEKPAATDPPVQHGGGLPSIPASKMIEGTGPNDPKNLLKPPPSYSDTELDVLQQLSNRRKQLQIREQNIVTRENLLSATSSKVEGRLAELKTLQEEVKALLAQYNAAEDKKLMSLVKIYENMKPREAAKIFEQLDMETLLPVVDKMKESKSALILSQMDPIKAKDLTTELSNQRTLPKTTNESCIPN